ncbi:cadherin domain protein [Teladorsagia circumcincta]|uniref:Cadherin domain protein n=1 Tax=Teladorsagia circumcincta TaxID=45464 RepID=A0A2G9UA28_TELCI|nr:cadherin domain protein [Teladorsagia circumcincta]
MSISSREGYVPETAVVGTTVRVSPNPQAESLQILVSDEDLRPGMPPATYQYILTGPGATIFAVDQRGFLYLNAPNIDADPPNPSSYQLNVVIEATDGGGKSSQAIVVVLATHSVFSLASLAPLPGMETFVPNPAAFVTTPSVVTSAEVEETIQTFVTEVAENTPVNTVVVSLGGDSVNDDVYFAIAGGNNEEKFAINEKTGTITTVGEFDRERTAMYSLQIDTRSRHPDQHLYWTLVQISVLDVNDNSPHFVGAQPIRLRLSVDNLDQLTANMVIDADDNGRLELRVAPDMNRLFTVSNDGVVAINGDFTAAHFGEHRLFIVARDHGDPPRESKAEVIVSIFGTLITMATELPTTSVASSSPRPLRLAPVFNPPQITVTADENEADIEIAKAAGLAVDPSMPHFVSITVHVGDVNDWIPNFESSNYNFVVQEDTMPGTIIGQVTAFDQDKEDPNNRIRYRLVSAGGLENYFAVNGDTGLITLALQVDAFAGEKITME